MSSGWIALLGPITGLAGLTIALIGQITQRRSQRHTEWIDAERLGHEELVAALEERRNQIVDLRAQNQELRELFASERAERIIAESRLAEVLRNLERSRRDPEADR